MHIYAVTRNPNQTDPCLALIGFWWQDEELYTKGYWSQIEMQEILHDGEFTPYMFNKQKGKLFFSIQKHISGIVFVGLENTEQNDCIIDLPDYSVLH